MNMLAINEAEAKALIASIRKDQFGIAPENDSASASSSSVWMNQDAKTFLARQHARLERALKRLSEELYATSTHFVLELLQNADDNRYEPHVTPRASFRITQDAITFFCNECGFEPEHVRAICDVGASTKKKKGKSHSHGGGSIGHKGIGFKSVFMITHVPEIHSNGFHLRFNASPNGPTETGRIYLY